MIRLKKRILVPIITWGIVLLVMIPILILLPLWEASIILSFLWSAAGTIWVFSRYASLQKFPKTAYLNIGLTLFFSFSSIGILATDISYTLYNQHEGDVDAQEQHHKLMLVFWNIIYWGNIACGTILNRFFQRYWKTGNFTIWGRVISALKMMIIDIIALFIIVGCAIAAVFFIFGFDGISGLKTALLMLNHVYGMLVLTWLLGYGIIQLPLHIWSRSYINYLFYKNVTKAGGVYEAYRNSQIELYRHVNAWRNAIDLIIERGLGNKLNYQIEILERTIPNKFDDGIDIKGNKDIKDFKLNKDMNVNDRTLGQCRFKLINAFYQYKRKKSRWISTMLSVISLMRPLDECKKIYEAKTADSGFEIIRATMKKRKTERALK